MASKPQTMKRWEVHTESMDFRKSTHLVEDSVHPTAHDDTIVVKNHYVGINATDLNITNGAYTEGPPPHGCGLDGMGVIEEVGKNVAGFQVGDTVVYSAVGAFAEYVEVPATRVTKVDAIRPELMPLMVCGASASMTLEYAGEMATNETVLVTAAAGASGQLAVQLAKLAGNHVIGTCSTPEKAEMLKSLGCDRVINYKKENTAEVLKKEYPSGINLVFDCVGGELLRAAVENVAIGGRVIIFGFISGYVTGEKPTIELHKLADALLHRSATLRGAPWLKYAEHYQEHMARLLKLVEAGKLKPGLDASSFVGIESVPDAVEHLYSGKSSGKIIVKVV